MSHSTQSLSIRSTKKQNISAISINRYYGIHGNLSILKFKINTGLWKFIKKIVCVYQRLEIPNKTTCNSIDKYNIMSDFLVVLLLIHSTDKKCKYLLYQ